MTVVAKNPRPRPRRTEGSLGGALGARVRRLRQSRKLTLQQLGDASGLAPSTISKVENGQISPTYDNLLRLAEGLGIEVTELFRSSVGVMGTGRRSITKHGEGAKVSTNEYDYEMLCAELTKKKFIPLISTIKSRIGDQNQMSIRHEGEEFIYVISGSIEVYTEHYKSASLKSGDSCYFDSTMSHYIVSTSESDAVILWVCSRVEPPLFE